MNKRKYYGKKIKKTRNIYRKRKTAGQKVFGTVVLVTAVGALAFLGFCIGRPLLDYLGSIGTDKGSEWTPAASYSEKMDTETTPLSTAEIDAAEDVIEPVLEEPAETEAAVQPPQTANDAAGQAKPAPPPVKTTENPIPETQPLIIPISSDALISVTAPANTLANRASLSAFLAKAKSGGYNSAVVQLKDRNGFFRYKTVIEGAEDGKLIADTMTLDEIMSVFDENGMIPIAEIAVLSDNAGCEVFTDMSYKCMGENISWLDYTMNPPRRWANPDSQETREYFAEVTAELTSAGFEHIMLTDVIFPDFQSYDSVYIAQKYYNADRYQMLYSVVKAGNMIEVKASDVLAETYGRTAEVLTDTSQLHDNSIALVISRSDLPADKGYPADAKSLFETVLSLVSAKVGDITIVPVIDGSSFDDSEKQKIIGSLGSLGYESYIVK